MYNLDNQISEPPVMYCKGIIGTGG